MKNRLLTVIVILFTNTSYSQNRFIKSDPKKSEHENYKIEMDSLSKIYKKEVTGYMLSSIQNKSTLTLFYNENKKSKDTTFLYTYSF
jgi:hypothetical protein